MYKYQKPIPTTLKVNVSYEGERIEEKVERIVNNKEAITDGAPQIYTERRDGVLPQFDIRTDRFEVAVEAMDKVTKSHVAKREANMKLKEDAVEQQLAGENKVGEVGKPEPIHTTGEKTKT